MMFLWSSSTIYQSETKANDPIRKLLLKWLMWRSGYRSVTSVKVT